MEIKSIIREIKLSELLNERLSGDALIINDFFNDLFDGMEIITLDEYPDSILFIKNGNDFYMEQDYKNERLYCSRDRVWSFFEENLSLDNREISDLIKGMVEQQLKEKAFTPNPMVSFGSCVVEQQLKEKAFTPVKLHGFYGDKVEQQLKEKVFTPKPYHLLRRFQVE